MHEGHADASGDDAKRVHIGAKVVGTPIDGAEPLLRDLFRKGWTAYGGREAYEGYEILRRMVAEDHAIVLAFSGAMASAGFVDSTVVPLIRAGIIDAVTTTHANVYHGIQRLVSDEFRQVDPRVTTSRSAMRSGRGSTTTRSQRGRCSRRICSSRSFSSTPTSRRR